MTGELLVTVTCLGEARIPGPSHQTVSGAVRTQTLLFWAALSWGIRCDVSMYDVSSDSSEL